MSYILEALKKSERQRRLGAVPRLDTPQEPSSPPHAVRRPGWLRPLLLLNLLLVVALLAYLLLPLGSGTQRFRATEEELRPAVTEPEAIVGPELPREETAPAPMEVTPESAPVAELPPSVMAGPPPRWSELPADLRQRITPPPLEVHVYSENPARRFVMIRGRQYREGDPLPDQLRLDEITPQGVILSWHGESFRLER